jgi:hypothetical protein
VDQYEINNVYHGKLNAQGDLQGSTYDWDYHSGSTYDWDYHSGAEVCVCRVLGRLSRPKLYVSTIW